MLTVNVASAIVATLLLAIQATAYTIDHKRSSLLHKRDTSKLDLNVLQNALDSEDSDLEEKRKRTCAIGINSHHCSLASMDDRMLSREWLNNGYSPGKRSNEEGDIPDSHKQAHRDLEEIAIKRQAIQTLKRLLLKARNHDNQTQAVKRSCRVRLGGLCLTESLDRAASEYYYLRSPHSPGRRRRSTGDLMP